MPDEDRTAPTRRRDAGDEQHRPSPRSIGRYRVLGLLGHGGMGVVHAAFDEQLQRRVAIKEIDRRGEDHRQRRRARREAQALARLTHPNIVAVHEVLEIDDRLCIVMEHVVGQTLRQWLRSRRPPRSEILSVLFQAGRGVVAAHAAGLVHRDLKPDNIMVGDDGRVRVMDFGLARVIDELEVESTLEPEPIEAEPGDPGLEPSTHTTSFVGTPGYAAPEQHLGLEADTRSDVFGFCVLAFEALHGRRPFPTHGGGPRRPSVLDERGIEVGTDGVPSWLDTVLQRGLALEPEARWPSMEGLLEALGRDPVARRNRHLRLLAAIVAVVFLAVALASAIYRWRAEREREQAEEAALTRLRAVEQSIRDAEAAGDETTAEAAFRAFVTAPENRGTRALAKAWLGRGVRKRSDPEEATAAFAEAYVSALAIEEERASLRGLADLFFEQWNDASLRRVVTLSRARGETDPRLDEYGLQAALWQRDIGGALRELDHDEHPRASWRSLLESLHHTRAVAPAVTDVAVLPAGGPVRVAVRGYGQGLITMLDENLDEVDSLDIDEGIKLIPGHPWALEEQGDRAVLFDLVDGSRLGHGDPLLHYVAPYDATGDGVPELMFTRKWPHYGFDRWDVGPDGVVERPAHPLPEARGTTFESHVVSDLDGDGIEELVIGFGEWLLFEIIVFRPDARGELEIVARHRIGRPGAMTTVRRGDRTLLAVFNDRFLEAPEIFPEPPHTGAAPGLHLFSLEPDGLVERETYELARAGTLGQFKALATAAAGDIDGDGLEDVALSLAREPYHWLLVYRQTPTGFEQLAIAGLHLFGGAQLDDDEQWELLVKPSRADELVVLGLGDEPLAPLRGPEVDSLPTPQTLDDPALAARWRRADDLAQLELPLAAAASLREGALLTHDRRAKSVMLDRGAELLVRDERPLEVLELEHDVHDDPEAHARSLSRRAWALSRLGRYEDALAVAREQSRSAGPGDEDTRARVGELSAMLDPRAEVHTRFDGPLCEQWRLPTPGAARRDPAGWLELAIPADVRPVAELPFDWDGRPLALELDFHIDRIELGACVVFDVVGPDDVPWLGYNLCESGGGEVFNRTTFLRAGPHSHWSQLYPKDETFGKGTGTPALLPAASTLTLAYFPERAQVELVLDDGSADGLRLAASKKETGPPPGRHRLVIRGDRSPNPNLAVVRIDDLRLRGARPASVSLADQAQWRPAQILADGDPRAALQALDRLASPPPQSELLRLMALGELGELGELEAATTPVLAHLDDPQWLGGLTLALRRRPVAGAALRDVGGSAVLPLLFDVFELAESHRSEALMRQELLVGLRDVERLRPRNDAERGELRLLLERRAELWRRSGDLERARRDLDLAEALSASRDHAADDASTER